MSGSQGYKDLIDEKCISANGQVDAHSSEVPLSVHGWQKNNSF